MSSLYDICIRGVAQMLNECYWPISHYELSSNVPTNPFSLLPSHINEELILNVVELTPSGSLGVKDLYPILSSGRIEHFKFENAILSENEFVAIVTALSVHGMKLISLKLSKIFSQGLKGYLSTLDTHNTKSKAIECLIAMSPNLESVESDIQFDLRVLQNLPCLRCLKLNFVPKNELFDLIPKLDNSMIVPNNTLTHLSIFEDIRHEVPMDEMAFILMNCRELVCIENSIARALKFLHEEELFIGSLVKQYKLQKYVLGDTSLKPWLATATVNIIHIATVTCPFTRELDILVCDHKAIAALSDFKLLESFLIQWEHSHAGDFRLALQNVLECIGNRLKMLYILNFELIAFDRIGKFCPHLSLLRVDYENESNTDALPYLPVLFQQLKTLHLDCQNGIGVMAETLMMTLSNCKDLSSLHLCNVPCLTDDTLTALLDKNKLTELSEAVIIDCNLSEFGLALFIQTCTSLKFLNFKSFNITFNEAVTVVHDINPFVNMSTPND